MYLCRSSLGGLSFQSDQPENMFGGPDLHCPNNLDLTGPFSFRGTSLITEEACAGSSRPRVERVQCPHPCFLPVSASSYYGTDSSADLRSARSGGSKHLVVELQQIARGKDKGKAGAAVAPPICQVRQGEQRRRDYGEELQK